MSLDIVALGVWVVPGRSNWDKVVFNRESDSCGRKKSGVSAQIVSCTGCGLRSGTFQRWLVAAGSSGGSSANHLLSLWLLQERCSRRGAARAW